IGLKETAGELEARLAVVGARLAVQAVELISRGTAKGIKQDQTQASKAPKLKKEHGLIDWNRSPIQILDHIRAMQPWPTAYTFFHQQGKPPVRVLIIRAKLPTEYPLTEFGEVNPGQPWVSQTPPQLWVHKGLDFVEILELQPAGKR